LRAALEGANDLTDVVDPGTRSRMMRGIKGRDTKPEMLVRRYLHAVGIRFRLHARSLPGRPDIVIPGRRVAIFVHGCFWHRHMGCRFATTPASRREFWEDKFSRNVERDARKEAELEQLGWRVFTVWECETRDPSNLDRLAWRIWSTQGP
jgi:DNA mismatch endonuclease (patch repair protein)